MFGRRCGASTFFRDECDAESRLLALEVLRRVIEFALGQPDPGLRLELQCGGLKLVDAHEVNSTPRCFRSPGRLNAYGSPAAAD